ncbi:MAG: class I SAM-dependent methyltransferase [Acidimicrobiales bacterium]
MEEHQKSPRFAADPATGAYYENRASEYDDWYTGAGLFVSRDRPGWQDEISRLTTTLSNLAPALTIDVACGTGFLSQHLKGPVVGLDQSRSMVQIARTRIRGGAVLIGDALDLGIRSDSFFRVFTGSFYGHLSSTERHTFLDEARRVGTELVVVDAALRPGVEPEQWQERVLNDGSRYHVYKRYLTADQLSREIRGEILFEGYWFVASRATW